MNIDHRHCYEKMLFSRRFEEAITAGTMLQLQEGDDAHVKCRLSYFLVVATVI